MSGLPAYPLPGVDRARSKTFTHLSLAQLAERETVVFTAISRSSVRLREGRPVKKSTEALWINSLKKILHFKTEPLQFMWRL